MSEYLKPQSPLYHKKEDTYFYPLTTVDQVVLEDGSRLNTELSKHLFVDVNNTNEAEPNSINADTLGGYAADEYVLKSVLDDFIPKKIGCTYLVDMSTNAIDIFNCEIIKTGSFVQGRMWIRALTWDGDLPQFDRPVVKIVDFDTNIGDISRTGISSPNIHTFYIESDGIYVILSEYNTLTPGDYHIIF